MRKLKTTAFIIILCLIAAIACGKKETAPASSDTPKEVAVQESKEEPKEEEAETKEADADKDSKEAEVESAEDEEQEAEPAEDEEQEADSAEDEGQEASGIRPEFKEAMDSYEEFFDEYIDFMDTYSKSDNPVRRRVSLLHRGNGQDQHKTCKSISSILRNEDMKISEFTCPAGG